MKEATKVESAISLISDGASLMIGGFMGVGTPLRIIDEIVKQQKKDLTIIANDTAVPGYAIGKLIDNHLVSKLIVSHIGTNPETQRQMIDSEIDVELVPQGTLAERIRSAGYGLGGVLTPTGLGTLVEENKEKIIVDNKTFLLEKPLFADFALVYAKQSDYYGNLDYSFTAQNFNPLMAMAASVVIAESRDIVPVGTIPPDYINTPGVLVDYLLERES